MSGADDCVSIRVGDSGPGVADAVREILFQPFGSEGKEHDTGLAGVVEARDGGTWGLVAA